MAVNDDMVHVLEYVNIRRLGDGGTIYKIRLRARGVCSRSMAVLRELEQYSRLMLFVPCQGFHFSVCGLLPVWWDVSASAFGGASCRYGFISEIN